LKPFFSAYAALSANLLGLIPNKLLLLGKRWEKDFPYFSILQQCFLYLVIQIYIPVFLLLIGIDNLAPVHFNISMVITPKQRRRIHGI